MAATWQQRASGRRPPGRGDGSLFVGSEELVEAWRIFTPLLHEIDASQVQPVVYPFGVRAPDGMDAFARRYGIELTESWQEHLVAHVARRLPVQHPSDANL